MKKKTKIIIIVVSTLIIIMITIFIGIYLKNKYESNIIYFKDIENEAYKMQQITIDKNKNVLSYKMIVANENADYISYDIILSESANKFVTIKKQKSSHKDDNSIVSIELQEYNIDFEINNIDIEINRIKPIVEMPPATSG